MCFQILLIDNKQCNFYLFLKNICFIYLFNLFLAVSSLSCDTQDLCCSPRDLSLRCTGSSMRHMGFSLVVVPGLQSAWALWLRHAGLVSPRHVGSQFPDRGSNLSPMPWKVDSLPLGHQGSPQILNLFKSYGNIYNLISFSFTKLLKMSKVLNQSPMFQKR